MSMNHHTPAAVPTPLCGLYEPLLALLLADELDAEQTTSVRTHLAGCPYCQQRLRELEHTVAALRHHLLVSDNTAQEGATGRLAEPTTFAEPTREPAHTATPTGAAPDTPPAWAMHAPAHLTLEDIMLASRRAPADSLPEPISLPPIRARPGRLERTSALPQPSQLLSPLGAIAALLLLTLLVSALFAAFRGPTPGAEPTPTPRNPNPFVPYLVAAPGLPCDQNALASSLWSGDQGICLSNPPRTRLVVQEHLLAVMRWDANSYSLPANYKISVQVTLEGATTAKLEMDDDSRSVEHVIACSPHHCDLDGHSGAVCACDTSGPLTLAVSVNGASEHFYVGSTLLGSVTEVSPLRPDSIGLGVSAADSSAQGGQAVFADFAVVAV